MSLSGASRNNAGQPPQPPGRPLRMGSLLSNALIARKRCSGDPSQASLPWPASAPSMPGRHPRALKSDPSAGLPRPTSAAMRESVTGRGTDAGARSTPALAQTRRQAGCRRRRSPLIKHWASSGQPEDPALHHLAAMAGSCGEPGGGGLSGAFPWGRSCGFLLLSRHQFRGVGGLAGFAAVHCVDCPVFPK